MSFFVVSDPLCLIFQHINPDSKTNKSVMNKSRTNFIVNFKPFWELTFETLTSPIFQNFIKTSAFWFRWIKYFSDFLWIWNSNFEWKKYFLEHRTMIKTTLRSKRLFLGVTDLSLIRLWAILQPQMEPLFNPTPFKTSIHLGHPQRKFRSKMYTQIL